MFEKHAKQWKFLKKKFESDQLSHAYLFSGVNFLGKKFFAKEFVKLINCKSSGKKPCIACINCKMIEKNAFPDLFLVDSADGGEIQISQIREAQNFLSYKSYYGYFKAVIVNNAEKMNAEAQNCFLKTLEEPKGRTLIILISSKPNMLLPTIYSRCQIIKFFGNQVFSQQKIDQENKIFQDLAKLASSDLAEKFRYAKSIDFESQKLPDILEVFQKYFRKLLFGKIGVERAGQANYSAAEIREIIKSIEEINFKTASANASARLALELLLMKI